VIAWRRFAQSGVEIQGRSLRATLQFCAAIVGVIRRSLCQTRRVIDPDKIESEERRGLGEGLLELGDLVELFVEVIASLFEWLALF
jgi:hypothetical protein